MNFHSSVTSRSIILCIVLASFSVADGVVAADDGSQLLQAVMQNNPGAFSDENEQVVLVSSEKAGDVLAKIYTFEKENGEWQKKYKVMKASGGRTGFAGFDKKREGDGHAPSGIFDVYRAFGYDETAKTGLDYSQVTDRDWWIDDVESDQYNTWVTLEPDDPPYKDKNEVLKRDDRLYRYAIIVEYNTENPVPPNGSAIFMHWERGPGEPTAGCIATSKRNMLRLFRWLDKSKKPRIIMGNEPELLSEKWYEG